MYVPRWVWQMNGSHKNNGSKKGKSFWILAQMRWKLKETNVTLGIQILETEEDEKPSETETFVFL